MMSLAEALHGLMNSGWKVVAMERTDLEVHTCDVCGIRRECANVHRFDPNAPALGAICTVCEAEAEAQAEK